MTLSHVTKVIEEFFWIAPQLKVAEYFLESKHQTPKIGQRKKTTFPNSALRKNIRRRGYMMHDRGYIKMTIYHGPNKIVNPPWAVRLS